jgi:hypothetical protein
MKAFEIKNTKEFMAKLLASEAFDDFLMLETKLTMATQYILDGHLQKEFFDTDEWKEQKYAVIEWSKMRPTVFSLIKGTHTPVRFQISMQMKPDKVQKMLQSDEQELAALNNLVSGFYVNIRFEKGKVQLITAVDYKTFTMDKSAEKDFDQYAMQFLSELGIDWNEI